MFLCHASGWQLSESMILCGRERNMTPRARQALSRCCWLIEGVALASSRGELRKKGLLTQENHSFVRKKELPEIWQNQFISNLQTLLQESIYKPCFKSQFQKIERKAILKWDLLNPEPTFASGCSLFSQKQRPDGNS